MFLSLQTVGKLLIALNVALTGGVLLAGGSFLFDEGVPTGTLGAFEGIKPARPAERSSGGLDLLDAARDITADKFIFTERAPEPGNSASNAGPVQPAGAEPPKAVSCPFKVKGIMLSTVEEFTAAIVEIPSSKEQRTVVAGDIVEGVEILRIKTESIVILQGDEEVEVPLLIADEGAAAKGPKPGSETRVNRRGGRKGRAAMAEAAQGRPSGAVEQPDQDPGTPPPLEGLVMPPNMPPIEELAAMPTSEIIKKLPPKLQEWWAKLPQAEKDQWENRFRKRFEKKNK